MMGRRTEPSPSFVIPWVSQKHLRLSGQSRAGRAVGGTTTSLPQGTAERVGLAAETRALEELGRDRLKAPSRLPEQEPPSLSILSLFAKRPGPSRRDKR